MNKLLRIFYCSKTIIFRIISCISVFLVAYFVFDKNIPFYEQMFLCISTYYAFKYIYIYYLEDEYDR